MKRPGLILAALVPLPFIALKASSAADNICFAADALLDAGMIDEATTAYIEILSGDRDALEKYCAVAALPRLQTAAVDGKLAEVQLFESRADYASAAEAVREAIRMAPASPDVLLAYQDLLRRSMPPEDDPFSRAAALADFGMHEEAQAVIAEAYKSAADSSTVARRVPAELQYLSGGKIDWWRGAKRGLAAWAVPFFELLVALILTVVLVRILYFARNARPELRIEAFSNGGFEAAHLGEYFSNNLLNRQEALRSGMKGGYVDLVTGPLEPITIPSEISAVVPDTPGSWLSPLAWLQAALALFSWLVPRRTVALTGELHCIGSRGIGVSVRLTEKNRLLVGYAFWQTDFDYEGEPSQDDDEEKLYQQADYVAVWLLFETMELFGEKQHLLGTDDWRSYALFRAGCQAERDGRFVAARQLYQRALDKDPVFRGARANLGRLLIGRDRAAAQLHLEQVWREAKSSEEAYKDPTLYSAVYYLAAMTANDGDILEAADITRRLLKRIYHALDKARRKEPGYESQNLHAHLEMIRPAVRTMYGALLVMLGNSKGETIIAAETKLASPSGLHQFNLACAYSILAAHEAAKPNPAQTKIDTHLDTALVHLRRSFDLNKNARPQAESSRYLKTLRQHKEQEFQALLEEYGGGSTAEEDEPLPLAEVAIIGDANARALAELDIRTADQLLTKTLDSNARRKLADTLGTTVRVVAQWAKAVDLMRIIGLGAREVRLLQSVNVTSIAELSARSAKELAEDLGAIGGEEEDRPTADDVRRWIDESKTSTHPVVI